MKSLDSAHAHEHHADATEEDELPRRLPRGGDAQAIASDGFAGTPEQLPHLDAIQQSFGKHDVSGIRAHVGGAASAASDALGANAYASGDGVAFAQSPDLRLAAHEAAHTVQQRGGVRLSDNMGRAGDEYEQHADEVADAVVRGQSAEALLDRYAHRGAAGGSAAIQRQDRPGRARRTGGGGGARGSDRPSAVDRIVQEPNPAQVLDTFRDLISRTARASGVPFPSEAFNALTRQITAMLSQHQQGALSERTEHVEANVLSYRFRLWGNITFGPPSDVRAQRGRGDLTSSSSAGTTHDDTAAHEDEETDRTTVGAEGSYSPGDAGGRGGSVSGERQHTGRAQDQRGSGLESTGSSSRGTSMRGALEHIAYTSEVQLQLQGALDIEGDGVANSVASWFGASSADSTVFQTGGVIGEVPREQTGAAAPSRGRAAPRRPHRIE